MRGWHLPCACNREPQFSVNGISLGVRWGRRHQTCNWDPSQGAALTTPALVQCRNAVWAICISWEKN